MTQIHSTFHQAALWVPEDNNNEERGWGWTMTFGVLAILAGLFMIGQAWIATYASIVVLGWSVIVGAVIHGVHGFRTKSWKLALLQLLVSSLYLIAGIAILRNPGASAAVLTLMIAAFLMGVGFVRVVLSLTLQPRAWGWMLANGILGVCLGFMVLNQWPVSALWVIGMFVGIDLLIHGVTLCAFSMALHERSRTLAAV